jgi:DNA-binding CsgD family transcriptional regulator
MPTDPSAPDAGSGRGEGLRQLSPKERECLRLVLENRSSKQIARELGIAQTSVDTHIARARAKLGARDRHEAARRLAASEQATAWTGRTEASGALLPPLASLDLGQRILMMAAGALVMACVGGLILSVMAAL